VARTENDSWDIATSVGATAVMVALARAAETKSPNPLIRDEYAEVLVSTPELAELRERLDAMWASADDAGEQRAMDFQQMIDYQAVRTHFFDEFFAAAMAEGIRQHVILASGLDSRAYRLTWPAGTVVFEIDLPAVLDYKFKTLAVAGASPSTTVRDVGVDLRHDWPAALREAGFDADAPTVWLAEGLLPFLHGDAQEAMFTSINELSAPDSRIALEVFGVDRAARAEVHERWQQARAEREARGEDTTFDVLDLWYHDDEPPDCAEWFTAHGWTTQAVITRSEFERLGRPLRDAPGEDPVPFLNSFVTAELPAQPVG
jgi:methyltransferase (TIGR00027 family)